MSFFNVGESDEGDVAEDLCDGELGCLPGDCRLQSADRRLQPADRRLHPVYLLPLEVVHPLQSRHPIQDCRQRVLCTLDGSAQVLSVNAEKQC